MTFIDTTDVKSFLGISGTSSDTLLTRLAGVACAQLETLCNRTFQTGEITERFKGDGSTKFFPSNIPFTFGEDDSITIGDGDPLGSSDVYSFEDEGYIELKSKELTKGELIVAVYQSGFETIPEDVKQAAVEMAALMFNRGKSIGIKSESDGPVSVTYETQGLAEIPSVQLVVDSYRIPNFA